MDPESYQCFYHSSDAKKRYECNHNNIVPLCRYCKRGSSPKNENSVITHTALALNLIDFSVEHKKIHILNIQVCTQQRKETCLEQLDDE